MKASRQRSKRLSQKAFGIVLCGLVLMPTSIGYQDLAALIARQPAVAERWRQHIRTSTFGTIHAATFSFPRPMGASIPDPYFTQLASVEPSALEYTGSISLQAPINTVTKRPRYDYPQVDRSKKGDRQIISQPPAMPNETPEPVVAGTRDQAALSPRGAARKGDRIAQPTVLSETDAALDSAATASRITLQGMRIVAAAWQIPADAPAMQEAPAIGPEAAAPAKQAMTATPNIAAERPAGVDDGDHIVDALVQFAQPQKQTTIFFGSHAIGFGQEGLQPWQPDEAPTVMAAPHVDPEIKKVALEPLPAAADAEDENGESVAPKGEVTGDGQRPRTPAERLDLSGKSRAKHQQCLANAIYFEARGEVERGQMAVAQVVLNRVFSGYYPGNVCDVVYQNAHRHLACQFTFACDNQRDVVREPEAWETAERIARDALDGKFWLPEVGKATHYHATYVRPWWVRSMNKHAKLGVHVFYRPRRWGEGSDIPVWGDRLDVTGSIAAQKTGSDAQPVARRSIFDPVEEITPGG